MNKRMLVVSVMISLFALYLNYIPLHKEVPLKRPFAEFPFEINGWAGKSAFFSDNVLDKLGVSEYMMRQYERGPDRVGLYVGYYGAQKQGAQIHSPRHCLPGSGWVGISEKKRNININNVGEVSFVEALYRKGEEREMFVYFYKMKNDYITNEYMLKLHMVLNSLRYGRNDAAFVRFSIPVSEKLGSTTPLREDVLRDFLPLLKEYLPE